MNLFGRAKNIITQPKTVWHEIAAETTSTRELYVGYILPLAAIGPIASIIGFSLIGISLPFVGQYRLSIGSAITHALVTYILTLAGVYVLALIVDALAPNFLGEKNRMQALKVAAYASTASWLGGIFLIFPAISIIGTLAGLYSLYLFYVGLPVLMKTPQEKALVYTVVVIIAAIIVFVIVGMLTNAVVAIP
jgi:hypothetical protein